MAAAGSSTKTNERPGTRSQVRYVRMSASKARIVLDLIRGKHVGEASQILAFSERLASEVIMKCLRSAVANAEHNDEIPAEELFISACYADEGPTLKRFRPRARGRAGRIHKQTCHITIVVSRYDDDQLDEMRRRAELKGASTQGDASADRRRRVAKSQAAEETPDEPVEETPAAEATDAEATESPAAEAEATEVAEATSSDEASSDADGAATSSDEASSDADGAADTDEETD